jgi:hypothetical protein
LIWFENSAHEPQLDEEEKFSEIMNMIAKSNS